MLAAFRTVVFNLGVVCLFLETEIVRDRDETCHVRDRDSSKRVSRPRPSLETPSLVKTQAALITLGKTKPKTFLVN